MLGVTNLLSGDIALTLRDRLCSPAPIALFWLAAALPQPPCCRPWLCACSCSSSHSLSLDSIAPPSHSCLSSFTPWRWQAAAAGRSHSHALRVAVYFWLGVRVYMGEREQRRALLLEREAFCFLLAGIAPGPWGLIRQGLSPWVGQY